LRRNEIIFLTKTIKTR